MRQPDYDPLNTREWQDGERERREDITAEQRDDTPPPRLSVLHREDCCCSRCLGFSEGYAH